ncbi:alpha-2-macroglobulin family protein [Spirosoma gilvum]
MQAYLSVLFVLITIAASAQSRQPDYARDWKRADSLANKGLPKSALDIANRIYKEAKAQKNYPQVVKAAMHRMIFRSFSDENAYAELVQSVQADINDTPEPARSVLQSVLADIYWQYFQQNRYKFYNRAVVNTAATNAKDSLAADFRTWDARQLVGAATSTYLASVRSKDILQKTPIGDFDVLLQKGDPAARPLRPSLYDLLAHRALDFFQNTEPDLLKPVFKFELDKADYLAGPDVFAQLPIKSLDSLSGRYQALLLYQQLLALHLKDTNPDALADVDVLRLAFVYRYSIVPNKDTLYRQTLEKQTDRFKNNPIEAVYAYRLAEFLAQHAEVIRSGDGEDFADEPFIGPNHWYRKEAKDICQDIIKRYPSTQSSQKAKALLSDLVEPSYSIQIENVATPRQPFRTLVSYRNVPKLLYRIIPMTMSERQAYQDEFRYGEDRRKALLTKWLARTKALESVIKLPDDGDLNAHSVEIPISGLPAGQYMLLITSEDKLTAKSESVQLASFTVSELSYLVVPTNLSKTDQTLFIANRTTGQPISNASVSIHKAGLKPDRSGKKVAVSDKDGRVTIPGYEVSNGSFYYQITAGNDTLLSDTHYFSGYRDQEEPHEEHVVLFTDRGIYRPGQPIYVKGILYEGKANQYTVEAGEEVTIELRDQNWDQITEKTLKTNEFGTFTTTFTAPTGRLTGQMTLQTEYGSVSIRVEEYKRPTFEVKVKPIRQSFKLGQTVSLTAEAKTFSGAVVDKASVRYRITRRLRQRWYWWYRPRNMAQAEIANGTATTDEQGSVQISFTATPDLAQSPKDNPVFDFEVTVDVTDVAGETRSVTQTLGIGYSALQAELKIPAEIEKDSPSNFPIKITNQSGQSVSAKGQLIVYKLQPPIRLLRKRLWQRPDRQLMSRAEFERLFPNDLYANEIDPRSWTKGEIVQQQAVTLPKDSIVKADLKRYAAGEYVAELAVTDSAGEQAKEQAYFTLIDEKQPIASARPNGWLQVRKSTVNPGEKAVFWVGTNQPSWVLMTVEEKRAIVRQEWIKTEGRPKQVTLPITENQRGGFAVHFSMIQNGRFYERSQPILVPFTNKQLTIETETFRNKLKPGQREEWTLKISGLNKEMAEAVATLYDASLDAFARLDWQNTFYQNYTSYSTYWQSGGFSAVGSRDLFYRNRPTLAVPAWRYDQLSWLGYRFSPTGNRPFPYHPDRPFGLVDDALRVTITQAGGVVSGVIKDAQGIGAPGVIISLKGTSKGTNTNAKGEFSLNVGTGNKSITLVFSFVGYNTGELTITKKKQTLDLLPNVQALSEVVVVGYGTQARRGVTGAVAKLEGAAPGVMAAPMQKSADASEQVGGSSNKSNTPKQPELINPRRNFNETAFFFPQLKTDEKGRVVLKFTMPEALTRWRLLAFAHTKDLKTGTLEREIVTQKELMITANAPRFLREGDTIQVRARLTNLSERPLYDATTNLTLTNALTGEPLPVPQRIAGEQVAMVAPGLSTSIGWTIIVPKGLEAVTCRLSAQSGTFTDGEEFTIPILPNRLLVTDSQPFWVNGPGSRSTETKAFKLKPLTNLNPELPVQHERLTVEVTSNPSWYALQSLPYLMEYQYECAEQLFSRLYANSLAAHIVGSKPIFRQVIAEWQKNPPKSPLQTNEELKTVTLENSPWLASARSENERQAKLGQLLDANRMESEQLRAFEKLQQLQTESGGLRWFGGMTPDLSMTLHILSGFGHLQKLGVKFPDDMQAKLADMQARAIRFVDAEVKRLIEEQQKAESKKGVKTVYNWYFSATQYLYARSFYVDKPVDKTVLAYLKSKTAEQWQNQSLQGQALSAIALARFGDTKTANGILASLRERTRKSEELGTYWPDNTSGLYWYQTPIETQAYLIEAFGEINPNQTEIDDMKRWLLRQKQTQSWASTKATTEAIYALLLRGTDWLGTGVSTQVSLGGQPIESRVTKADAITGYEKVTYASSEIKPEMGTIQITKTTDGPAWGALYWQHFEPLDRVMPGSAGLSVQKTLYVQRDSPSGPVISTVTEKTSLKPGDLIKVRLVLKTDRTMEYVHLKDSRASGFEPVAALSGYKYQNGIGYYESPRDASTDFFMSYLPVGTHVFEYDLRVAQTGDFSAGVATVQCFYAPEFSAHSAGERVRVKQVE